ncbi:Retrovirus-related Pol polyprotein from transposon opus [Sesamum angolense]|uniref:Retrovirus-related Pol polyprotein from transposon opus n=1 Tax=Sesamum angolense TaxID=2727404 RepID=A0AAE1W2R8_9LAMI|nr:Retrovirus-related Pol polyprotein from transposon opus [Sesamum angolense]
MMPDELPRKLPPKRAVDHEIELVPGTKPPSRAPYRMSQPELVELRKQLKEMLESGIIKLLSRRMGRRCCSKRRPTAPYVRIKEGDEAKTTVVTRYGAFEFLVMPFGFTNAPTTFSTMMNQVLARLREHELYAKVSKCSFAQETINFLGHIVERGRIRMDPKKVQAIEEWRPPSDVHDLRSFLGLATYNRRFMKGYSEIARPMTDLLKKTETWD